MRPEVSVLMPFRSAGELLADAARSVLASDVELELLAIDDNDEGDMRDRAFLPADPRVRVVASGGRGIAAALNLGLGAARSELIARMDADDLVLPGRFEAQIEQLREDSELGLVGTLAEAFGPALAPGIERYVAWQNTLLTPEQHRTQLFVESPLCHPSVMMRRATLETLGGYRHGDFPEDYDLWLRFDAAGVPMAKVPELGVRWRQWPTQATRTDERYRRRAFLACKAPFLARRIMALRAERELVVWGAGVTGKHTMRALEPFGLRAARWLDVDPRKIGRTARGAPIVAADERTRDDFVLVALGARGARELAEEALRESGHMAGRDFLSAS